MKRFIILLILSVGFLQAQDYVGVKKCKSCHNKDKTGAQFSLWEGSKHAAAYETLKSEAAAKIAAEKGLKVPAYEAPECVSCHVTGFGKGGYEVKDEDFWGQVTDKGKPTKEVKRMSALQNVGCEACHGPGSDYKSRKTMQGIYEGTIDPATVGLLAVDEKTCESCHNDKSPTFKGFNFKEYSEKIAHPIPAAE